eukprot:CAMPEP_0201252806 /NCGR_PEP_ID=MMETSP0852-20130820/67114_1 /ASSEMBLY_ACC=CAM_ASM_000632 /TAXON_ID=183588 /ORGANISM="Pseudo-nitzschia fraudulenta, Strain WWA7" /LENGTH=466 /DNA_ID=CAMNT_0047552549 /DNA_START=533 /DNA_END=1933 /DNA_ORIENTATION=-
MSQAPEMSRKTLAKIKSNGSNGNGNGNNTNHSTGGGHNTTNGSSGSYQQFCFNVDDFQLLAKKRLRTDLYEYLASGSDDEQTLSENRLAFKRWFLRPRVLRPVGAITTKTVLRFERKGRTSRGFPVAMPIFVSPAGVHALCDNEHGECATARACARASILFGLSQHSTRSIEDVASTTTTRGLNFYQAYILKDRDRTVSLVRRALRSGYKGIFLTVDSVRFGYREADARNGFNALPPPHRLVNYDEPETEATTAASTTTTRLDQTYNSQEKKAWDQNSERMFEQNVSWEDVSWIKRELMREQQRQGSGRFFPLVVKGIMTAEDAILAVGAGADGIMVSNHGGRQLDGCLSALDVLPEVVDAIRGSGVPVWIDGGIRRGTDVLKALALGASAVGIGKPVFFALGVGGEDAVSFLLHLLQTELEAAMAICGIERIEDVCRNHVTRHPAATMSFGETRHTDLRVVRSSL